MADDISIPSPTYRVPRHAGGMDPVTRRLALIAAGIGATVVAAIGGWTMLNQQRHGVPVVQADSGPMRVRPANPGGLQVAGVNNDIFSGGSDINVEKLAPPPETPDPQALRAPPAPSAAPSAARPPAPPPAAAEAHEPAPLAATQPLPKPPAAIVARAPEPVRTAVATAAAAAPPAGPPAAPVEKPMAAGGRTALVQLAALSSEAAAKTEWDRMVKRWPEFFTGREPAFSRIDHAGQTMWRVRTGGFADATQATAFCDRLRAKGGNCSVADF